MSKPVVVTIPHELGQAEARRRIDEGFTRLVGQVGSVGEATREWRGDVLHFALRAVGQSISGTIAVAAREVRLEILLPGFLAMIADKLRGRLKTEGQILLGPPKKG